jgi:hypothetical protein
MNPMVRRVSMALVCWLIARASIAAGDTASPVPVVNLRSLVREMVDPDAVARFPALSYRCLQASSYNRASTNRLQPDQTASGWFADGDGVGFIRIEQKGDRREWVIMEHEGPGCITRIWTPFFYYDLNNHTGPNVRIYLDGADEPVVDESLIQLVRGEGTFVPPVATPTARAGDSYVPIPFAMRCKITLTDRAFYNVVNYRAYPQGTRIETFTRDAYRAAAAELARAAELLTHPPDSEGEVVRTAQLSPGRTLDVTLPPGAAALRRFVLRLPAAATNAGVLRSTVISMTFDGEETVWCPVGDFFCSADSLHPFHTFQRAATPDGALDCRWVMPYRDAGVIRVENLGAEPVSVDLRSNVAAWRWGADSMHFHAHWRPDDVVPGAPFRDWNFIDITGQGVYVGDVWTVLNIQGSWWGEGDEKIYVDDAWDAQFPTHFGTGTEDYYGWAGGEVPTRKDEFSTPFLANVRVGGLDGYTTGFNICTRTRSLDAIPFTKRLVFDMESSFGTDIRNRWNLLGYSAVTFCYAKPGATHNRPSNPGAASKPILQLEALKHRSEMIRSARD